MSDKTQKTTSTKKNTSSGTASTPRKRAKRAATGRRTIRKKESHPQLFDQVCRLTGIPSEKIKTDLNDILERKNLDADNLTLEQLRHVAAAYLREIMGSLLDRTRS